MVDSIRKRNRRRFIFQTSLSMGIIVSLVFALYLARSLLLPCFVGIILAYLFKPVVYFLKTRGVKTHLAVTVIVFGLVFFSIAAIKLGFSALPQGLERYEMLMKAQNRLNHSTKKMLKIQQEGSSPIWIYEKMGSEIDYLMTEVNSYLQISSADEELLLKKYEESAGLRSETYKNYLLENRSQTLWKPLSTYAVQQKANEKEVKEHLALVMSSFSRWILLPIVFFFLLADDGMIFRFLMRFIPNHYFELTLTMLERVDKALGHFLRGTILESSIVGAIIGIGMFLFSGDFQASMLIGILSAMTNAVPFLGTLIGLISGLAYSLIAEDINPVLPFVSSDFVIIGVFISVGVAHLIDNAFLQPVLVGKAIQIHPLAVLLAIAVGGVAFGFMGVLLALPTLVVSKTCVETLYSGLRDYRLI